MGELKSRSHTFGQSCYHIIMSPRCRFHLFKPIEIRKVCEGALRLVADNYGLLIHELRVMEDHVHLFVEIPPRMSVSKAIQVLKGVSSRILRRRFSWLNHFKGVWSRGTFYRSVGNVTADVVEHYISRSHGNYSYFDTRRVYNIFDQTQLKSY